MNRALEVLAQASKRPVRHQGPARAAVCFYYDQPPVQGKQEIKLAVRRMSREQKIHLLVCAGVKILRELDRLVGKEKR